MLNGVESLKITHAISMQEKSPLLNTPGQSLQCRITRKAKPPNKNERKTKIGLP
jgi:hypothetical protein